MGTPTRLALREYLSGQKAPHVDEPLVDAPTGRLVGPEGGEALREPYYILTLTLTLC